MMKELIADVAHGTGLPPEQAALAVAAVLRFFTARLPSALVGELHARLRAPGTESTGTGPAHDPERAR